MLFKRHFVKSKTGVKRWSLTQRVRLLPRSKSMTQSVLNFTLRSTDKRLTPKAGEAVFGEFLKVIHVDILKIYG